MKYKLISTDIDGTIVPYLKNCPEEVDLLLEELLNNNILVVPNTGRPFNALKGQFPSCHFKYAICGNGATVFDIENNKIIYEASIENNLAADIIDYLTTFNEVVITFMNNSFYADSKIKNIIVNGKFSNLENSITFIDNITDHIRNNDDIIQKIVLLCNEDKRDNYELITKKKFPQMKFTAAGKDNVEINNPLATKDIGLKKLCEYININLDEVIVMGDNDNDVSVLSLGCFNIVPSNGNDNAKKLANVVCDSCENFGPLLTIKEMFKNNKISNN